MTRRTSAYKNLQALVQETFDFAVVICHAVPALKLQMKLLDDGKITKLPEPDYFEANNSTERLRVQANGYKDKLATYLFLSTFAFFENYLGSVLNEIIDSNFTIIDDNVLKSSLVANSNTTAKKNLRGASDARHIQRYEKYSKELRDNNYIQPDTLIKSIALENLKSSIGDLKANQIPDFLIKTLKMPIPESEKIIFSTFRQLRNDIAHGDNPIITMRRVKEANKFLKKFASSIDEFLIEHYVALPNFK